MILENGKANSGMRALTWDQTNLTNLKYDVTNMDEKRLLNNIKTEQNLAFHQDHSWSSTLHLFPTVFPSPSIPLMPRNPSTSSDSRLVKTHLEYYIPFWLPDTHKTSSFWRVCTTNPYFWSLLPRIWMMRNSEATCTSQYDKDTNPTWLYIKVYMISSTGNIYQEYNFKLNWRKGHRGTTWIWVFPLFYCEHI